MEQELLSLSNSLIMFPGQGSQFVGMGKNLHEEFPLFKLTFEEASDTLNYDLTRVCLEDPEDQINLTEFTQPIILTMSIAMWRVLQKEIGLDSDSFAGHSLGEYSALVASAKLDFKTALTLVRKRGAAMQKAIPAGVGSMAAVMKCEDISERCAAISTNTYIVEVANYNSPMQAVISGHKEAVTELCAELTLAKIKTIELAVSAPFHSSLMQPVALEMTEVLNAVEFKNNNKKIFTNLESTPTNIYNANYLIEQIYKPVLWNQILQNTFKAGIINYIEVGPKKVLTGLAKRSLPKESSIVNSDNLAESISNIQQLLESNI